MQFLKTAKKAFRKTVVLHAATSIFGITNAMLQTNWEKEGIIFLVFIILTQCTRFFQNFSRLKVNGGISSMNPCIVPFERAFYGRF